MPREWFLSDFDYNLPPQLIAVEPARPRDAARLMRVTPAATEHATITKLPQYLRAGDVLVLNDTRVIPARLYGKRGDIAVEILLHQPKGAHWLAFARPAKRLRPQDVVTFSADFSATVIGKTDDGLVELAFSAPNQLMQQLEAHGEMPLPPYIARPDGNQAADKADYQTIYARHEGAVAAPTAGLHFTPQLLQQVKDMGVTVVHVTLHVGAGTFLPVRTEKVSEHRMHSERGEVTPTVAVAINQARQAGGRIVCVGTTSLRLLESAVGDQGLIEPFHGQTDIFITPGYVFRTADVLMTNFHLPQSTLLMLVSAFAGYERIKGVYAEAIKQGYRFYSYGDACLLERHP